MADLKYEPVPHDHEEFLKRAKKRKGFREAYEALGDEYILARENLSVEHVEDVDDLFKKLSAPIKYAARLRENS